MMIKLTGGKLYDPANGVNGEVRDIYIADGRVVAAAPEARVDQEYNLRGKVVMAGAIDPHTHIGGGKVTIARTLMPEDHEHDEVAHTYAHARRHRPRAALDHDHRLPLRRDGLHGLL